MYPLSLPLPLSILMYIRACVFVHFSSLMHVLERLKCNARRNAGMRGDILDLAARLDIAIDVAHAVTYLHMYTGKTLVEAQKIKVVLL